MFHPKLTGIIFFILEIEKKNNAGQSRQYQRKQEDQKPGGDINCWWFHAYYAQSTTRASKFL